MILRIIGALIGVIAFAIYIEAPKKYLILGGILGAFEWFVYLMVLKEHGVLFASFMATVIIAFLSHVVARIVKAPVTVFLIPGLLPLVPGAGMYRTVYQIVVGNRSLAMENLLETMQVAGLMAIGIFIVDSIFRMVQLKKWKEKLPIGNRKHHS